MTYYFTEDLTSFFDKTIDIPDCHRNTKSYIIGVFSKPNIDQDLSKISITIEYAEANIEHNFQRLQQLGDQLLFIQSIYPTLLKNASSNYYNDIAQCSYYRCYKLLNKQWVLFEELADRFPKFTKQIRKSLEQLTDSSRYSLKTWFS